LRLELRIERLGELRVTIPLDNRHRLRN
jgi:hypothetical protein